MSGVRRVAFLLWGVAAGLLWVGTGCDKAGQNGGGSPAPSQPKTGPDVTEVAKDTEKAAETPAESLPPDLIQVKAEISRAKAQLDMTVAKLEILLASGEDIETPSEEALAAIEALDEETQELKKRGDEMRERGAAYFEAWEKELADMTTVSVKKIAEASRDDLSAKYADLLTAMQEARAAFDPLWTDVQAIQTAIEDGLTAESLKVLAPQVKKVKDASSLLKSRIDAVQTKVDNVATIYTQS